jgi:hypothetical protein
MTEQEAIDLAYEQSGAAAGVNLFFIGLALLIAGFTINWLVQRSRAKAQVQRDILAELKKANAAQSTGTPVNK